MKTPVLILGFLVACLVAATGCGDDPARPASSAKDITAFTFLAKDNPGLTADVSATINGTAISAVVPFGTDVTALVATFDTTGASVTISGAGQVSGVTRNDFTAPVTYRVTAADVTTRNYVVTVTVALSTAKQITSYKFLKANNTGLGADVTATINGTSIAATVPFGTTVTGLVATFATTGTSVTVGGNLQVSGTTANDFTSAVTYRVLAANGSPQEYTVTVTIAPSTAKEITSFKFLSALNNDLDNDITATINGTSITATVPFGTAVNALIATFETTGTSVTVDTVAQVSGTTANDFRTDVEYKVTAADQSTQTYTVKVIIAKSTAKKITSYKFLSANNPSLRRDITATINGFSISATVPFDADVTDLVASFEHTGVSVAVGDRVQTSGDTSNDFTDPVDYQVTAADDSSQVYTVTVAIADSTEKDITSYKFLHTRNPTVLHEDVTATINGLSISATVPFGTDVTALIATFDTTGDRVTVGNVDQVSDITPNDFTGDVEYKVTASGGSSQVYTVKVTIADGTAKAITSYKFLSAVNGDLGADITATINGQSISATVPFGTDVTALIATFDHTGVSVSVGETVQDSGQTPNDFTGDVDYKVTAADGTSQIYTVKVTIADGTAKAITSYKFLSAVNGDLGADITATINGQSISATVPFGTDVTALIATFDHTGVSVTVGETTQDSGHTPNDFSGDVDYKVTAADGTSQIYTVKVTIADGTAKAITSYKFESAVNADLDVDVIATISGTLISATVPFGTDVTALIATFDHTGVSVAVGETDQDSGHTPNDFTGDVEYKVTAADGTSQIYTVEVTIADGTAKAITSYKFLSAENPELAADIIATINGTSISATVPFGTDVTALIANFAQTGVSVVVGETEQDSGHTANDFTGDVEYKVTAADGTSQIYTVKVTIADGAAKELTSYKFLAARNPGTLDEDVTATINGPLISATVPFGTDVTALIATFEHTGASVAVGETDQDSDHTPNDFTSDVEYTVTAADATSRGYTVTVTIAAPPEPTAPR